MLVTEEGKNRVRMGESFADVLQWLRNTPPVWPGSTSTKNVGFYASNSWALGASYSDAVNMGTHGWEDGVKDVALGLEAFPPMKNHHYKMRHDVAGNFPDVPAFLSGRPDCMVRKGRDIGHRPVLSVMLSSFISAMVPAQCLVNYGVALCVLIDRLEAAGRRVELSTCFHSIMEKDNTHALCGWTVKHADEPLDLTNLAFAIAHPAAFRRIGFAMYERLPMSAWDDRYGMPAPTMTPAMLSLMGQEEALVINGSGMALTGMNTPQKALAFAIAAINRAAGEAIVEVEA